MADREYDIAVFIGRFQIFHNGHVAVLEEAFRRAEHVIVLVGSIDEPRSYRNPFTFREREDCIYQNLTTYVDNNSIHDYVGRLHIFGIEDTIYNDGQWVLNVQNTVNFVIEDLYNDPKEVKVALIGHEKDHSSFYLKLFPQWSSIGVPNIENISSTELRKVYFSDDHVPNILFGEGSQLPKSSIEFLTKFKMTHDYVNIREEYEFVEKYKRAWANAPYPVNLLTVDACVIKSGHILLVTRGARPGKGLLALPGGYVNVTETVQDAMLRELKEETRLKVPDAVLKGCIAKKEIFDDPNRSARGRVVTVGYLIDLGFGPLDKVKGGDDACKAQWFPLGTLDRSLLFEDHYSIIQSLIGIL